MLPASTPSLSPLQVAPPLELTDGPAGRRLSLRVRPDRLYWGVVQCHGPAGTEPDFPDNRYWVAIGSIANTTADAITAKVHVAAYPIGDPRRKVVAATNFFENNDATHLVRPQTVVRVWADFDRGSPAQLRWTMIVADQGTSAAAPCTSSSSSSSSSSSTSSESASSTSSTSASSGSSTSSASTSASGSASASSGICPPGYTGSITLGGLITRVGDVIVQPAFSLSFCQGALVSATEIEPAAVNVCCPPSSTSIAGSSSGGSSSSSSGGGSSASSSSSGGGSSSGSTSSSSSGSVACLDPLEATCGLSCIDGSLPSSVVVDTSAIVQCVGGCPTIPASITAYFIGSCADSLAPLYIGQDFAEQITVVIEWDAGNGCFILYIEGSTAAPSTCRQVFWAGYGGLTGTYTRLCGSAGGCGANAGVPIVNVH